MEIVEIKTEEENDAFAEFAWEELKKEFDLPKHDDKYFKYFLKKFAIFDNGKIIATCGIEKISGEDFVKLREIAVAKNWRRKGLGKQITMHALKFAQSKGFKKCRIGARTKVMGFYEKLNPIHTAEFYDKATGPHEWLEIDLENL